MEYFYFHIQDMLLSNLLYYYNTIVYSVCYIGAMVNGQRNKLQENNLMCF